MYTLTRRLKKIFFFTMATGTAPTRGIGTSPGPITDHGRISLREARPVPLNNCRRTITGYRRIPHRDLKNNWSGWERRRHWDSDREWREGWRGGHEGRERHDMEKGEHKPGRGEGRGKHGNWIKKKNLGDQTF